MGSKSSAVREGVPARAGTQSRSAKFVVMFTCSIWFTYTDRCLPTCSMEAAIGVKGSSASPLADAALSHRSLCLPHCPCDRVSWMRI